MEFSFLQFRPGSLFPRWLSADGNSRLLKAAYITCCVYPPSSEPAIDKLLCIKSLSLFESLTRKSAILRQEIDGSRLDIYNWPPISYLHFLGREKDGLQAGHLQLASCLHFLRQGIRGFQVRYLQPASCLLSEMEVTTETG